MHLTAANMGMHLTAANMDALDCCEHGWMAQPNERAARVVRMEVLHPPFTVRAHIGCVRTDCAPQGAQLVAGLMAQLQQQNRLLAAHGLATTTCSPDAWRRQSPEPMTPAPSGSASGGDESGVSTVFDLDAVTPGTPLDGSMVGAGFDLEQPAGASASARVATVLAVSPTVSGKAGSRPTEALSGLQMD
jgi:hypothetical protein